VGFLQLFALKIRTHLRYWRTRATMKRAMFCSFRSPLVNEDPMNWFLLVWISALTLLDGWQQGHLAHKKIRKKMPKTEVIYINTANGYCGNILHTYIAIVMRKVTTAMLGCLQTLIEAVKQTIVLLQISKVCSHTTWKTIW